MQDPMCHYHLPLRCQEHSWCFGVPYELTYGLSRVESQRISLIVKMMALDAGQKSVSGLQLVFRGHAVELKPLQSTSTLLIRRLMVVAMTIRIVLRQVKRKCITFCPDLFLLPSYTPQTDENFVQYHIMLLLASAVIRLETLSGSSDKFHLALGPRLID